MRKKCVFAVMALVLSVSMVFSGCSNENSSEVSDNSSVVVDIMPVEKGALSLTNQFIGTVSPEESVYIIPMAQGTVTHTYFEVGDTVQAGDVLFEIDDTAAQMQLDQAQLTYNNTKAQVVSSWTSTNDQLEASLKQLEAQRIAALAQLEGAQTQYFTLLDSVNQGNATIKAMKEQHDRIDSMSTDEVLKLAQSMGESLIASSGGISGSIDLEEIFGSDNQLTEEAKEQLAEMLRPELKAMLFGQIQEIEASMKQAQMSLNTAETSMQAAEKSYYIIVESMEQTQSTDLGETKAQLDNNVELAKLAVESARLALSYYDVTSPISGTVISKAVQVNGFATSSQPSYIIANDDIMTVTFHVSESVKNTLTIGTEFLAERNGVNFKGVITEVGNAVNQQTGLFQIKGTIYANGEELPSGVSVKLSVETYKAEDTIIIPYDAVYYENNGAYVYTVQDGIAQKTYVTTGIFDEENIEITSGLFLEDRVIVSWSPRLIDGAAVKATAVDEAD